VRAWQTGAGFLKVFPKEQIHFVFYDDIYQAAKKVLHDLFVFLGADADFLPQSLGARINERAQPRSIFLRDRLHQIRLILNRNGMALATKRVLIRIGIESIYHLFRRANLRGIELPTMNPDTRSQLNAAYAADVAELSQMTRRDLSQWLLPPE